MRWERYSAEAFDPRPYWFERHQYAPGQRLPRRPRKGRDVVRYGFDDAGRVVVTQEFSGFLRGRQVSEESWHYGDAEIERTCTDGDGGWVFTHHYRYDGELIIRTDVRAKLGTAREEYTYADGVLVQIDSWDRDRLRANVTITYGASGELDRIESTYLQGRRSTEVLYARPPRRRRSWGYPRG